MRDPALRARAPAASAHPLSTPAVAQPRVAPPEGESIPLAALPGWPAEDHAAALQAFAAGCGVTRDPALAASAARRARLVRSTTQTPAPSSSGRSPPGASATRVC